MVVFFRSPPRCRGFSLVELLVVLAIVAILVGLAAPSVIGTSRSLRLNATSDMLINQLNLARQAALSNAHLVQVRFYRLPDYNQDPTSTPAVYRGVQCFIEGNPAASGSPALTPLTKVNLFPSPIIVSTVATPNVSPLFSASPSTPSPTDPPLPVYGSNYTYFSFHYRPNGTTDLTSGSNSFTLVLENDGAAAVGLPANYRTIQIDPALGTARRFSP
ncbi:MAG: Verru_Chthon cassette protein D [Verrucomicrobiota bacterium]